MGSESVLSVHQLDVHYGEFQAIWDVSLNVAAGSTVSIIGANGAGKSTLLKTIAGALQPSRGQVVFRGEMITSLTPYQTLANGLALVPEGRRIFQRLTVRENLLIGAYAMRARKNRKQNLEKVCQLFPRLMERINQLGTNLSGGEQQMLAIGRALMSEPRLILFDEISLGLAPVIINNIYSKLKEINGEGVTLILVEQDIQRSLKAADWAFVMQEGKVALQGDPKNLTEEAVKKAYFGL